MEQQVIPDGYKQTEVGVIPEDWVVKSIGYVLKIRHGKSQKEVEVIDGLYPIYGTGGEMGRTNTYLYNKPSVLIGRKGSINKPRFMLTPFWTVDTLFYSEVNADIDPKFIYYKFCLINWMNYNEASGVPSLNASTIENIAQSFPSEKCEQTAIANALSDVDVLIASIEKLIAKKQAIKTATMQQLLTGEKRLPPFDKHQEGPLKGQNKGTQQTELGEIPEDWEIASIGEGASMKSGSSITSESIDNYSSYPCYGGNGLRGYARTFTHDGNYALIGRQGALCGNVVEATGKFFASEHAIVVTPQNNIDIHWLAIVLKDMNLNQYSESSAQPGLSAQKLQALKFPLPILLNEQTAISNVLSDIDTEIDGLEKRLAKTQQIKQGMMQELLTGKTRLPFDKTEAQSGKEI